MIHKKEIMRMAWIPEPHGKKFPQTGFARSAEPQKRISGKLINSNEIDTCSIKAVVKK
jgi:hypothetical protein